MTAAEPAAAERGHEMRMESNRARGEIGNPAPARNWVRIALWLVSVTSAYNFLEAAVALWAGVTARSIALVGFGLDSIIEFAASIVLLWRLSLESRGVGAERLQQTEHRVHRFVGGTFIGLALYVLGQSAWILLTGNAPGESRVGIALALVSLILMPLVARWKLRAASEVGSAALRAEAMETLACSYLSLTLFLGLVANALAGWWWADPVAALVMVPWLVKEGLEGLRGDGCACR